MQQIYFYVCFLFQTPPSPHPIPLIYFFFLNYIDVFCSLCLCFNKEEAGCGQCWKWELFNSSAKFTHKLFQGDWCSNNCTHRSRPIFSFHLSIVHNSPWLKSIKGMSGAISLIGTRWLHNIQIMRQLCSSLLRSLIVVATQ